MTFGREFYKNPDILLSSFEEMNRNYKVQKNKGWLIDHLKKVYIFFFGIPEIGLQVRSLYFKKIIGGKISPKISRILDAGSGIGIYSFWLSKNFPDSQIEGWEIDKKKILFSKKMKEEIKLNNVNFFYQDLTKVNTNKKYDLIINIDVLEHIQDYKKVLRAFYRILNKKGYLYLHTPQPNQRRIFKAMKKWEHESHIREGYEEGYLIDELKNIGFRVILAKKTFGFFGKLAWELNHLSFKKGFILAGILFPFLYVLSLLDINFDNKDVLGSAILAKKI